MNTISPTTLEEAQERYDLKGKAWVEDAPRDGIEQRLDARTQQFIRRHLSYRNEWRYVIGPSKSDDDDMVGIYFIEWEGR